MKIIRALTLFFISVIFCNAQQTTRLKNNFHEPVNPHEYLLETFRGLHPKEFKGKLKTVIIKDKVEDPEELMDLTTTHYFNSNSKYAYTVIHIIKTDTDYEVLENIKDTIYPEKIPLKLKDIISPENEIRYSYNNSDQLSELREYHLIRGEKKSGYSTTVKKINNSVKQVTYNSAGMAVQVKIFFYEATHQLLSEDEINYTYTSKGWVSEIKTISKSFKVSKFNYHKPLLSQEWTKKELTNTATTLENFIYDAVGMLVSGTYLDEYHTKKYHITQKNNSVNIEYLPLNGSKKEIYPGKYEVLLDPYNNPFKMIEYERMENGELEPTGGESFTITYTYH